MSDDKSFAKDFGASFKGFLDQVVSQAPKEEPFFLGRLREHFGEEPQKLPVIEESMAVSDHPNLQAALDAYLGEPGRSSEILGVIGGNGFSGISLPDMMTSGRYGLGIDQGPVQYVRITTGGGKALTCVQSGLYLVRDDATKLAILVRGPSERSYERRVGIEVMSVDRPALERFLTELRALMRKQSVYRGKVLSLSADNSSVHVQFHELPAIDRDQIILPEGVLARIERQTMRFSEHREKLLAAGRHLKRGLLLHGPPGTGKTLTAMYLAGRMKERTTLLLVGRSLGLIEYSCSMARFLAPSTIILEDVDLVAEDRSRQNTGCNTVLFELLNQMDGLASDADVLFVLTTNRPDILESALAARPGRIDQAIEVPLPDAPCRDRLLELYGRGLSLRLSNRQQFIDRTDGVSAAFMRELLRRAALFAADREGEIVIEDQHLSEALHDLVVDGGELTKSLLGAQRAKRA